MVFSNYIDVDINETRKYGMLIAQTYSKIVGNDIELFKEYVNVDKELEVIFSCISRSSHRNIDNNESRGNVGDDNNIDQITVIITNVDDKNIVKNNSGVKCTTNHNDNDTNDNNEDSDSDDSIVGYAIDDDNNPSLSIYHNRSKDKILTTNYLRDCLTSELS
jgi:hypothetical protein